MTSIIFANTVYYVDVTNGNDLNDGLSPATAWKTISKVNNSSFSPGDYIYFKRGGIWREQLIVPSSGTSGNPITFGAYGNGNKPIISGADNITTSSYLWTSLGNGTNEYYLEALGGGNPEISEPGFLWLDGSTKLTEGTAGSLEDHEWDWADNDALGFNTVYFRNNSGDPSVTGVQIEAAQRNSAITIARKNYISLENLILEKGAQTNKWGKGVNVVHSDYLTITNCEARYNGRYGFHFDASDNASVDNSEAHHNYLVGIQTWSGSTNLSVTDSSVHHNFEEGLDFEDNSNNGIVTRVVSYKNGKAGFDIAGASGIVYKYCKSYENGQEIATCGNGFNIWNNADDVSYIYCISYDNLCYGIEIARESLGAIGAKIYNCVFFGNAGYNIAIHDDNVTVKNCIMSMPGWNNNFHLASGLNYTIDYNLYYNDSPTFRCSIGGTTFDNLYDWQNVTGQEANSINSDPLFVDAVNENFFISMTSPCIDAGTDAGLTQDYAGNTVPYGWEVDIGAFEYVPDTPLDAEINASPTSGWVPLTVSFTGSVSGGAEPYTYEWNFGDGESSSEKDPSHAYSSAGDYTVTLTVTDSEDDRDTDSLIINVSEKIDPLEASITASPSSGELPMTVNFTASASGGTTPYSYSWDFGDGGSSSSQNPSHTYTNAGTYSVVLTITDAQSNQGSNSLTITASPPTLSASASGAPTTGEVQLTVSFKGSASGGTSPYSYSWDFGDGDSSTGQNPSHTYTNADTYDVTLTVTDSNSNKASDSLTITVSSAPLSATASASPTSGEVPLTVSFIGSASGGTSSYSFNWDFGDGGSSSAQNPSHTYTYSGIYNVTLTVIDAQSSQASDSLTITASSIPTYQLAVSAATGSPAPGAGGTTDPLPGNLSYSVGNSVQVEAIPNENYRFSKWTGDVSDSETYNKEVSITMDKDKSISAFFCTKCGDVTGDLSITPADSQAAFEIFLGIISNPTESEKENADVNCSGTKIEPSITPGDAQAIFEKFLGINELPCDCSGNSRSDSVLTMMRFIPMRQASDVNLIVNDVRVDQGGEVVVPIVVDDPFNIKAFGFDFIFPSEILEFVGVERSELMEDFYQVDANKIAEGVVRAGGYKREAIKSHDPRVLITLVFKVIGKDKSMGISSFSIVNTVDDIKNATVKNERVIERVRAPRHIRRENAWIK